MRLNIRYADAHTPWLPKPSLTHVRVRPGWRYLAPRVREPYTELAPERKSVEMPKASHDVHPWAKRRKAVMDRHRHRAVKIATPRNTTEPWREDDEYLDELAWLIDTQEQELPTEADLLTANGFKAKSLEAIRVANDGELSIAPNVAQGTGDYIDAFVALEGLARVEAFLRSTDEQFWHNGPVLRMRSVTNGQQVGVQPVHGHVTKAHLADGYERVKHLTPADVQRQMKAYALSRSEGERPRPHRDDPEVRELLKDLDALAAESEAMFEDDMDFAEEAEGYAPSAPCPHPYCVRYGDECPICQGERQVSHVIGLDGCEYPPPGWGATGH